MLYSCSAYQPWLENTYQWNMQDIMECTWLKDYIKQLEKIRMAVSLRIIQTAQFANP
jgi:hypothetical protein